MEKFKSLFAQALEMNPAEIKMEFKLKDLPTWDSIAAVSFLAMVDADYGVKLTADDIRKAVSVNDLFQLVQKG